MTKFVGAKDTDNTKRLRDKIRYYVHNERNEQYGDAQEDQDHHGP